MNVKLIKKGAVMQVEIQELLSQQKEGEIYKAVIQEIEKPLIQWVLERTKGNQLRAAKLLGINRNTLRSKIKKLGLVGSPDSQLAA
jgi:DNA-binding protein Fis